MTLYYSKTKSGFFDDSMHDSLPSDAVQITEADHQILLEGQVDGKRITADTDGYPVLTDPPISAVSDRRASAKRAIDQAAGNARHRYVSAGQLVEEEYHQAHQATKDWRAAGSPADAVPADIQVWADAAGMSSEEAAQDIEATATAWNQVLSGIRQIRLTGKAAVDAAADQGTDDDMATAAQPYIDQLDAMAPT